MRKITKWICVMAILMSMIASFIPASAADAAPQEEKRYNIMLVIDGSGSLISQKKTDESGMRYELLQDLLGCLADDGHYIGAMVFSGNRFNTDDDASMNSGILMQTQMLAIDQPAPDGSLTKDYIYNEIKDAGVDMHNNGTTDIGTALMVAQAQLLEMQKKNGLESLVFLFTDGVTELSGPLAEAKSLENMQKATRSMSTNGIRLFGAFLNKDGKIESTELADAVCAANGISRDSTAFKNSYVEITDAASCHQAVTVLLRFLGLIGNQDSQPLVGNIETDFVIPGIGVEAFNIRLYSYNGEDLPDMVVALTRPDGQVITGSDLDNLCRSGRTVRTYKVTNPMSGQWHLSVIVPENNSIAYVYDKVYSLAIGSSISVTPDVADLHVNGTATFTATLTQRGAVVTDALAYEGYECCLEITDLRTNKPESYSITNNNGAFVYDLPLQEYGSYSARIVFNCDGFSVPSSSIPFELVNHEPTITGTVNKTVKYGPFQNKTTELDLAAYFDDVEDGKDLTIELVDSDCDEDAFKLKNGKLILTNAEVGSGSIVLSITDSQGAGGEMKVNITAKNMLPVFIAIAVAILILIAVIVILVLRGREGMNLKGELTVTLGLEIENEKAIELDLQIPGREAANKTNLKSLVNNALVNEAEKVKPGITNGMVKNALSPYMGGLEQITLSKVITRDGGKRSAGIQIKQGGRKYTMPGKRMVDLYVDDMSVSLVYARPMDEDDDVFGTDDMGMSSKSKPKKEKKADKHRDADFNDDLF